MALEDEDYGDLASMFEQNYRCYPVSFIDKSHLEKGDKIIMPPSALDRLAHLQIDYPMLFKLTNPLASKVSHCGVLEFVADEGLIYIPYWMMENMLLQEGDIVNVKNASLSKGTYVKLQPHTTDFLDLTCVTPSRLKEPEKPLKSEVSPEVEEPPNKIPKFNPFSGSARRLDGKPAEAVAAPVLQPHKAEATTSATNGSTPSTSGSRKTSWKACFRFKCRSKFKWSAKTSQ
ncbi:ubiquitin fusion degradation protein 1 [Tanacetum coccineum]